MARTVLEHTDRPAGLVLTRQNLPTLDRGPGAYAPADGAARGAYILADTDGAPDVILIATGSEVQIALDARDLLTADGMAVRVVSMPCREWFAAQPSACRADGAEKALRGPSWIPRPFDDVNLLVGHRGPERLITR